MNKIKKFEKIQEPDTITIPGLAELSQRVGENTSDIKHLKQTSKVVNDMTAKMAAFEVEQRSMKDQLLKLDKNDARISSEIKSNVSDMRDEFQSSVSEIRKDSKDFRKWLIGTVATSLVFGLTWYNNDQSGLESSLSAKINKVDSASVERHKETNKKLDKITDYLIPSKK